MTYSECGAAVHFKNLTVHGTQYKYDDVQKTNIPYEVDFFTLEISVEYADEDYDAGTQTKCYTIMVPIELEVNFTQERFDSWLDALAFKRGKGIVYERGFFDTEKK